MHWDASNSTTKQAEAEVGSVPAHAAGDPGLNPGPGKKFSLKIQHMTNQTVSLKT